MTCSQETSLDLVKPFASRLSGRFIPTPTIPPPPPVSSLNRRRFGADRRRWRKEVEVDSGGFTASSLVVEKRPAEFLLYEAVGTPLLRSWLRNRSAVGFHFFIPQFARQLFRDSPHSGEAVSSPLQWKRNIIGISIPSRGKRRNSVGLSTPTPSNYTYSLNSPLSTLIRSPTHATESH